MLANNNYPINLVDKCIRDAMDKRVKTAQLQTAETRTDRTENGATHRLFYQNTMSPAYKTDEKILRNIVKRHCKSVSPSDQLKLIVYYRNPTTRSMVMNNNPTRDKSMLKQSNVIYSYKCPFEDCTLRQNCKYIGHTTTSLSRRITMHLQNGGPKTHTNLS